MAFLAPQEEIDSTPQEAPFVAPPQDVGEGFTAPVEEHAPENEQSPGVLDYIKSLPALALRGVTEPFAVDIPKAAGRLSEFVGRQLPEGFQHKSAFTTLGEENQKTIEGLFPVDQGVGESVPGQLAKGAGMIAGFVGTGGLGELGAAGKGLALTDTAVPGAASIVGKFLGKPGSIAMGSMVGVPEFEKAKAAGKSDDEAFKSLVENYFVGTLGALPIESMIHRLNTVTGGGIVNYLKTVGIGGLQSGAAMATQTYLTNQLAKADYDPDRDPMWEVAHSALIGGALGMLLPGIGGALRKATPENRVKIEKKVAELQAKEQALKMADQGIKQAASGDQVLDSQIADMAKLSPEEQAVIDTKRTAASQAEEAVRLSEERQKRIDQIEKDLEKHEVAKKKSEEGKGTLLPEQKKDLDLELKELLKEKEIGEKSNILPKGAESKIGEQKEAEKAKFDAAEKAKNDAIDKITALQQKMAATTPEADIEGLYKELLEAKAALRKIAPELRPTGNKAVEEATGGAKEGKTVKMTPAEAIKHQVQTFYRGMTKGVRKGAQLKNDLVDKVRAALKGSPMTNGQVGTILTKLKRTNLFTAGSVSKLGQFIDKVATDAEYAEKLDTAQKIQKRIKSKKNTGTPREKDALTEFSKIDPSEVDIDKYLAAANEITPSFRPVTNRSVIPLDRTWEYINSTHPEREAAEGARQEARMERAREMADELGLNFEDAQALLFGEETNIEKSITDVNKKEKIREKLVEMADGAKEGLHFVFDDTAGLTDTQRGDVDSFKTADLDLLTPDQLKAYIRAIDRLTTNEDFGGTGKLHSIIDSAKDFAELKVKLKDSHILTLNDWEKNLNSMPLVMRAITGLSEHAAQFQNLMGMIRPNEAHVKATQADIKLIKDIHKIDPKGKGATAESKTRQTIFSELIKSPVTEDPVQWMEGVKQIMEYNVREYERQGMVEQAKLIDKALEPFRKAITVEEVMAIMEKMDPIGKKIIDKTIDHFKPVAAKLGDYAERYHNEGFVEQRNYSGPRSWRTKGKKGEDIVYRDPFGDLGAYQNSIAKPKLNTSALEVYNGVPTDGRLLNFDKHATMTRGLKRSIFDIEGVDGQIRVRENAGRERELIELLGGKEGTKSYIEAQRLYDILFKGKESLYFKLERQLSGQVPHRPNKFIDNYLRPLRKIAYNLGLSGWTQYPKQMAVISNVMSQLGTDVTLMPIKELLVNPKGAFKFFSGHTVSLRGAQRADYALGEITEDTATEVHNLAGRALDNLGEKGFNSILGVRALIKGDVHAAKISYGSFYKQYLKNQGIEYEGFDREADLQDTPARLAAHAYAKQRVDELQGVSNPAEMGTWLKSQDTAAQMLKAALIPFGTFQANTKSRMWQDMRAGLMGNAEQRLEAARDLTGTAVEQATFNGMNWGIKAALATGASSLAALMGLPTDKKWEKEQWDAAVDRLKVNWVLDMLPVIMIKPVTEVGSEAINLVASIDEVNKALHDTFGKDKKKDLIKINQAYGRSKFETLLDNIGLYGDAAERLWETGKLTKRAVTGTKEVAGHERNMTPEQQRFSALVGLAAALSFNGFFPSDLLFPLLKEEKHTKPGRRQSLVQ